MKIRTGWIQLAQRIFNNYSSFNRPRNFHWKFLFSWFLITFPSDCSYLLWNTSVWYHLWVECDVIDKRIRIRINIIREKLFWLLLLPLFMFFVAMGDRNGIKLLHQVGGMIKSYKKLILNANYYFNNFLTVNLNL